MDDNLNTSVTTTNVEKEMFDINNPIITNKLGERKKIEPKRIKNKKKNKKKEKKKKKKKRRNIRSSYKWI